MVPTVDTVRYEFLISALLANEFPVLLAGPVGTGKTSMFQSVLDSLNKEKYSVLALNMSAQTTSKNVQVGICKRNWFVWLFAFRGESRVLWWFCMF